jgi:hypothetical protein
MPRLLKRTTHQVNEQEANWSGFLAESGAENARWFLNGAFDAKPRDRDSMIREAWNTCRTILTVDEAELLQHFHQFQNGSSNEECRDLWGLVVVPRDLSETAKPLERIGAGLSLFPKERLHWPAAGFRNLFVRLTAGDVPEIRRFRRCSYCEKSNTINSPWDAWYKSLPVVQL